MISEIGIKRRKDFGKLKLTKNISTLFDQVRLIEKKFVGRNIPLCNRGIIYGK